MNQLRISDDKLIVPLTPEIQNVLKWVLVRCHPDARWFVYMYMTYVTLGWLGIQTRPLGSLGGGQGDIVIPLQPSTKFQKCSVGYCPGLWNPWRWNFQNISSKFGICHKWYCYFLMYISYTLLSFKHLQRLKFIFQSFCEKCQVSWDFFDFLFPYI